MGRRAADDARATVRSTRGVSVLDAHPRRWTRAGEKEATRGDEHDKREQGRGESASADEIEKCLEDEECKSETLLTLEKTLASVDEDGNVDGGVVVEAKRKRRGSRAQRRRMRAITRESSCPNRR